MLRQTLPSRIAVLVPNGPRHCVQEPGLGPSFRIPGKRTLLDHYSFFFFVCFELQNLSAPCPSGFLSSEESLLQSGADAEEMRTVGQWV